MACEQPHKGYQAATGGLIRFSRPQKGEAGKDYRLIWIPCGYCILCREEQARQQSIRIYHEAQLHTTSCFVTLTYSNKYLPEHNSLNYEHLTLFWKKLRNELGKLRYYAVGEYGDESRRPHYHACIFGHDFSDQRRITRTDPTLLWTNPTIEQAWGMGNVSVGTLNIETARYTASYVTKKLRSKQQYVRIDENTGELVPLVQPRAFMSRNLGKGWWEKNRHHVTAHDFVVINGQRQKPPKAYDRWTGERSDIALGMIKDNRQTNAPSESKTETHARARNARARAESKRKKKTL